MTESEAYVALAEVGTLFEAQLLAGALENAGIPARTDSPGAADEFTMSQRLLGRGIRVFVPRNRFDEAQRLRREMRDGTLALDVEDEPGGASGT